jgi:hypothetical protein
MSKYHCLALAVSKDLFTTTRRPKYEKKLSMESEHTISITGSQPINHAASTTSPSTIISIHDAFGFNLINSKLLADIYAEKVGLQVLMSNLIPGSGVPVHTLKLMQTITTPCAW